MTVPSHLMILQLVSQSISGATSTITSEPTSPSLLPTLSSTTRSSHKLKSRVWGKPCPTLSRDCQVSVLSSLFR